MLRARDISPDSWNAVQDAVLCFIRNKQSKELILIHKKTGLGAGLINAPGGKIEPGETPAEAAIRETQEEIGVTVENIDCRGKLYFQFTDGYSIMGYVFEALTWHGNPVETPEAAPFWCSEKDIPYEQMWVDDSWWLPHFLADRSFRGRFVFDGEKMLSMSLDVEVDSSKETEGIPRNL